MFPVLLANGHIYDQAEATSRRLAREFLIEHATYEPLPNFTFAPCEYCDGIQAEANLSFNWGIGSDECCSNWDCAHAVLDHALEEADPEDIRVTHPVLSLPDVSTDAA